MNYSDICLIPNYGILNSREDADVSIDFGGRRWRLPIIPANMKDTISFELAEWMEANDYFYILHRFYPYEDIYNWIKHNQERYISISVGVNGIDRDFLGRLVAEGLKVDCITIDVAHSYSENVFNMMIYLEYIYTKIKPPFVIVGNISGHPNNSVGNRGVDALTSWGAGAIKVGLSNGKACATYNQTGFASPMFSAGLEASKYATVPLIGDGGIRENGDIAKALVAGFDMVMAGSIFAACTDSPALFTDEFCFAGLRYKTYTGSAYGNQYNEGKSIAIQWNGMTYVEKLLDIENSLKSAVSYAGGKDLSAFKTVKWVENRS